MIEAHLAKLRKRDDISAEEEDAIRGAISDTRRVGADQILCPRGKDLDFSTLLIDGWAARVRDLPNGQRQITELHVAGDFVDLHSFTLKRLDHEVVALTPCKIAIVPHERLRAITEQFPHLTRVSGSRPTWTQRSTVNGRFRSEGGRPRRRWRPCSANFGPGSTSSGGCGTTVSISR